MVIKLNPKKLPEDANKIVAVIEPNDGGGNNMDKPYATKDDLKILETKIDGKISTLSAKIDGQFNAINAKLEATNKILWWLMGIVSAGIVIPLLAFVFKAIGH